MFSMVLFFVKINNFSLIQFVVNETSVPSIYFIGKSSVPLDIITGEDALDNVSERIENILSKGGITITTSGK